MVKYCRSAALCLMLIIFICISGISYSQKTDPNGGPDEKFAKICIEIGDYVNGLIEYKLLYKKDSANVEYNFGIATCYLNSYLDKSQAIPYLEYIKDKKDVSAIAYYDLGKAYMFSYRFEEAINSFKEFKRKVGGKDEINYITAERMIEMCNNAISLISNPINITFENLGSRINSSLPDFAPYVTKNEAHLYFTSKRSGNLGNMNDYDGFPTSDVFISENKYGNWDKPKRLSGLLNSPGNEETSGLSADGTYLFLFVDSYDKRMQTFFAVQKGKSFMGLQPLGSNVNIGGKGANSVTISPDKKTLIFSSKGSGGETGYDLYMSKLLPSGAWGPYSKLPDNVNTKYDEDFPNFSPDGNSLYFASVGHNSMGGFDIFKTDYDKANNAWSDPVSLGYPLNTPEDNTTISFTTSGRYAYMASYRKEGYGDLDIYRVIFNDIKPPLTALTGTIVGSDSLSIFETFRKNITKNIDSISAKLDSAYVKINKVSDSLLKAYKSQVNIYKEALNKGIKAEVKAVNKKTQKAVGTYRPNQLSGRFVAILPPGEYIFEINCDGYKKSSDIVIFEDKEQNIKEITRLFALAR